MHQGGEGAALFVFFLTLAMRGFHQWNDFIRGVTPSVLLPHPCSNSGNLSDNECGHYHSEYCRTAHLGQRMYS